jgi:hypothetical protein
MQKLRSLLLLFGVPVLVACPIMAHADTISTYSVSGSLVDGGSYSGSFTFNQTTGQLATSNITITDNGSYVFDNPFGHGGNGNSPYQYLILTSAGFTGAQLSLALPGSTPDLTYAGGLCTLNSPCNGIASQFTATPGGTAVDFGVAPTPEPSSLVLLGTGLLGVCGAARRRFRRV